MRTSLTSALPGGDPATLDGVLTNQYAFRQGEVDWSVWIEQGDRPLPRKLMIIDRSRPSSPPFSNT